MLKDKKMLALIIAIFLSVLLITGWVFADRNVMDLITATPIFEMKNTAPARSSGSARSKASAAERRHMNFSKRPRTRAAFCFKPTVCQGLQLKS